MRSESAKASLMPRNGEPGAVVVEDKHRIPKPKKDKAHIKPIKEYKAAYKRVYGILPEVEFSGGWVRILGHIAGVRLHRLREMTTQLKRRAG